MASGLTWPIFAKAQRDLLHYEVCSQNVTTAEISRRCGHELLLLSF